MSTGWWLYALAYMIIVGLALGAVATATVLRRRQRKTNADGHAHFQAVAADYQQEITRLRAEVSQ